MKLKPVLLFLIITICSNLSAIAQTENSHPIIIEGQFPDNSLSGQEIKFEYYQFYSLMTDWPPTSSKLIKVNGNRFYYKLDHPSDFGYLRMRMPGKFQTDPITNVTFPVEKDDHVSLRTNNGIIEFLGKDAAKYNMMTQINSVVPEIYNSEDIDSVLYNIPMTHEVAKSKQLDILRKARPMISKFVADIIEKNIIYQNYRLSLIDFRSRASLADSTSRIKIIQYFWNFVSQIPRNDNSLSALHSNEYLDFWFLKELIPFGPSFQTSEENTPEGTKFNSLFNNILAHYSGAIKDHLLAASIMGSIKFRDSTDYYLQKAISLVRDPITLNTLLQRKKVFYKGSNAFNFQLTDTLGNIVKLSDFKGKIIVLDFYFTGCVGCVYLSKAMTPVLEQLKDQTDIKFISVNLDKTMDSFRKAVKSGKYTHPGYINLYTNGKGEDHELVKFYNITGCPVLIVIDQNGKILDSDPPMPYVNTETTQKFVDILKNAVSFR